jgi:site-specific recombinase XerD
MTSAPSAGSSSSAGGSVAEEAHADGGMREVRWERYPLLAQQPHARPWLAIQADLGLARNTIEAYGRALEDYLRFSARRDVQPDTAGRSDLAAYVRDLMARPNPRGAKVRVLDSGAGLANATLQQRLSALRLYYDYLVEEGLRPDNPVGRGRYTPGKAFGGQRDRGLVARYHKLPWIPTDEQWRAVLEAARREPVRNRVMLALAYDAALRREELCALDVGDIDPAHRLLRVRAETTKNRQERVVPYSEATGVLFAAYLTHRRELSRERGSLFLSESRRNHGQPVSIWTWSKVVERFADVAGVPQFATHTPRHLCLTDLARAGWDLHEIARFAGHRSTQSTLQYIHLSGRDLAAKIARGMDAIHAWRAKMTAETLG